MSIATLKKKTQTKYNNMSVGERQFSINGTHRSQGYVGQTSLSRSLPRTLMKGNVAIGHGGCCGKFNKTPIIQSAVISLENPNVVKSSVLGTSGMISTKYQWIKRPQPYTSVKPDNNNNNNSQSDYITYLIDKTLNSSEYAKRYALLVYPPLNQFFNTNNNNTNSFNRTLTDLPYGNGFYKTTCLSSGSGNFHLNGYGPFSSSLSTTTDRYNRGTGTSFSIQTTVNGITVYGASWTDNRINSYLIDSTIVKGWWFDIELPYQISVESFSFIPGVVTNKIYELVLLGSNNPTAFGVNPSGTNIDTTPYWEFVGKANILDTTNNTKRLFFNTENKKSFKIYRIAVTYAYGSTASVHGFQFHSYDKYPGEKLLEYPCKIEDYTTISNCCNKKLVKTTSNKPGLNYNYAIPCGEYMKRLINCRIKEDRFYVATTNNKQPFAGFN